jgi:hypothetical protein
MSMSKMVPNHLKPQECKRIKLREPPPVPYVLEKDEVQDEVSKMRNMEIKTCHRPSRYVPYKGTFVPYDGTFGASDQGQTLDV